MYMATGLQQSFSAAYSLFERPHVARRAVSLLLVVHTVLLGYSAYVHSPTLNEPAHLVAGLSHWKFGRFELYRVNPPLVRMIAALPVMATGYEEDWSSFHEGPGVRPEFRMGKDFVAANGERSFFLFMIARWACIPFSWIGGIVCYLWAKDLYGRPAGVLASAFWCLEPNVLAHASLITPDAHASALGLAACYAFWRWLKEPTWSQAAITGVLFGMAEATKTTLILLFPIWPMMWLIYRWPDRRGIAPRQWIREAGMIAARITIGLSVLNLVYGFEGSFTQLKDFEFVSKLFGGSGINHRSSNRIANNWLGELAVPFPRNYVLGIDLQQHDFEDYGQPSYLHGQWRERGWWYYYLYAISIKVPLALWALAIVALIYRCRALKHSHRGTGRDEFPHSSASSHWGDWSNRPTGCLCRDEFILVLPACVFFAIASSKTGFSAHMRYILPAFPFVFIWVSQVGSRRWLTSSNGWLYSGYLERGWRSPQVPLFSTSLVGVLCWFIASSLSVFPHNLSYFNELIGGPRNGSKYLLGSNLDWGQGLKALDGVLNAHSDWGPVAVLYSGPCAPESLGLRALSQSPELPISSCAEYSHIAISANILAGEGQERDPSDSRAPGGTELVSFLRGRRPVDVTDYSIWVYETSPLRSKIANEESIWPPDERSNRAPILSALPSLADASDGDLTISRLLHVLQLNGIGDTGLKVPASGLEGLRILTNEQRAIGVFGQSPFIRTRNGLRYKVDGVSLDDGVGIGESHRDQCLATFGLLALTRNYPIFLKSEKCSIQDLIHESVANFSFDQNEIAWTAIAYAHYLPPARQWTDRFGRTTTFSELLQHLMDLGFAGQSCGGTHVLQAVIAIIEADYRSGILNRKTRLAGHKFLENAMGQALLNQGDDGSWNLNWYRGRPLGTAADADAALKNKYKIVVTGHMLESMHSLRDPPLRAISRSTRWLIGSLQQSKSKEFRIETCPLTHALRGIQLSYEKKNSSYELADAFATQ